MQSHNQSQFRDTMLKAGLRIIAAVIVSSVAFLAAIGQIQFDKPKAPKPLPNPSILGAGRDDVKAVVKQMLETREIPLEKEDCNSKSGDCTLVSKPVIFIKGITTRSQLEHYCDAPAAAVRNWTKGRYVLRIEISPASPKTSQVGVYAKFEGLSDTGAGSEWVVLTSKGILEDTIMRCIDERIRGGDCKSDEK